MFCSRTLLTGCTTLHSIFFFDGQIAVVVFMVLSGYFYYRVAFSMINYTKGILRKVKRIYPAHIIVLATAFVLCNCGFFNEVKDASEWGGNFGLQMFHLWNF